MKKIILTFASFIFLFCMLPFLSYGQQQDGTSLLPGIASPTAASLGEYGNIPVSLFTGSPNVSIPLFELKGRTLTLPVSLNYHSSGVKVEEIAGWAGQGWSLIAGGVITRTMRGLPDDDQSGNGYLGDGGDSTEVYLRNDDTPPQEYLREVYWFNLDGEPDRYFFNFAGRSGRIFFARDESAEPYPYRPYTSPQQDIRVQTQINSDGAITAWILTTEDGTRYTFAQPETSSQLIHQIMEVYTSSWYLTSITSPVGNESLNLTYQSDVGATVVQQSEVAFDNLDGDSRCVPDRYTSRFESSTEGTYLRKIETARQTATFYRGSRSDGGGMRLDSIAITNTATSAPIQSYKLVHGYFNAGGTEKEQRLRLDRLRQFGSGGTERPSWSFAYDTSPILPGRDSYAQDYWGYYNGETGNGGLDPKVTYNGTTYGTNHREPSEPHMLTGMLTEITYPTGGKTTLTWEGNRYGTYDTIGGGIRIRRIEHSDGVDPAHNVILEYKYGNSDLLAHPKMYHIQDYQRDTDNGAMWCHYISRPSTSYIAPGMMDGSVVMYPKVTVVRGENGEGGTTVKHFKVPSLVNYLHYGKWPYIPTVTDSWRGGGTLVRSKELTSAGLKLSDRQYNHTSANERSIWGVIVGARIISIDDYGTLEWEYIPHAYRVNNGAYLAASEINRTYSSDGSQVMADTVIYEYGNMPELVQMTKKTETNSDGTRRITTYRYAHEVTNDGTGIGYTPMKALHMLSQPYAVTVTDSAGTVLSKRWTLWGDSSGRWRPRGQWIWTGGDPKVPVFEGNN